VYLTQLNQLDDVQWRPTDLPHTSTCLLFPLYFIFNRNTNVMCTKEKVF